MKRQTRPSGWPVAPFAIALAVFLIAAGAIWYSLHRAALIDRASLHDRETAKEVEVTGDILEAGRLPLPDFVNGLTQPRQDAGEPNLELISPVGTAVLSERPTFRWKALKGDWSYRVRVLRLDSGVAAESGEISGTDWTPEADLASGINYQWQILAQRGNERLTFPQPPRNPPRFRVVDATTSARLRELAGKRGGVHLLLAIEYGKAGLIEDARRELQEELKTTRHAEAVERLIHSLDPTDR
jgi:hypothetical protein